MHRAPRTRATRVRHALIAVLAAAVSAATVVALPTAAGAAGTATYGHIDQAYQYRNGSIHLTGWAFDRHHPGKHRRHDPLLGRPLPEQEHHQGRQVCRRRHAERPANQEVHVQSLENDPQPNGDHTHGHGCQAPPWLRLVHSPSMGATEPGCTFGT